ncbi:competence protein ComEA [Dethiosulfatibacter aminovorans DSM 17477]|uniref:Competence protein ComEA n=1 Tax=Dethiosulfatibacter aminovorans DSM 17477 TaxID=1121476 RepID=A0A1M6CZF9_9FIRM|nr:helix-hairpin-helix domain-containing protein [Dethiosulfatibacter aminovorans]SHI66108.1 competence protein ComEA [Dethiosulfatibacter aminovorans DSM 17477]
MDYLKKRTLVVIIVLVLLVSFLYGFYNRETGNIADSIERNANNLEDEAIEDKYIDSESPSEDKNRDLNEEAESSDEAENTIIFVDIDGAVNNRGTFQLPEGTRLCTLIELAGGLTENADTRFINRAEKLHDEQKVYIPEKGEEIEPAAIDARENPVDSGEADDGMININTATKSALESLPGIGEVLATRIIEYRESNECFSCIEDIKKVSGIAEGRFNQIKDLIKVK